MKIWQRLHKLFVITLMLISFSLVAGCGFKDIDKRVFVQAIGIDRTDNDEKPYKVTLKLSIPTGDIKGSGGKKYTYLSKESESLAGAMRILKTHMDKEIDLGHARVIVLGDKLLEENINDFMDVFYRRRDLQMIAWVAVGKPTAEDVLKTEPPSEMAASSSLPNIFGKTAVESSYIVSTPLFDVRRRKLSSGINTALPVVESHKEKKILKVNKSVILQGKGNSYLHLDSEETQIYNLIAQNTESLFIKVDEETFYFIMAVDNTKVKYKVLTPKNKPPVIKMNVEVFGIIEEANYNLSVKKLSTYNHLTNKELKRRIEKLLKKFQEHELDPIGFGLRYQATRLHKPGLHEEWKDIYPTIEIDVTVQAGIKSTGTVE